jgi:hypothetical protein
MKFLCPGPGKQAMGTFVAARLIRGVARVTAAGGAGYVKNRQRKLSRVDGPEKSTRNCSLFFVGVCVAARFSDGDRAAAFIYR